MTLESVGFIILIAFTLINTILSALLKRNNNGSRICPINQSDLIAKIESVEKGVNFLGPKHDKIDDYNEATHTIKDMSRDMEKVDKRLEHLQRDQSIFNATLLQILAAVRENTGELRKIRIKKDV